MKASYKFPAIRDYFFGKLGIKLSTLPEYSTIDAVRVLNNSFKHANGYYRPKAGNADSQIEGQLAKKWGITAEAAIPYEGLPIKSLVVACGKFNAKLIEHVNKQLEAKT